MNTLGSSSIWYKIAIYFYLHFQYNGWFILALLGVLFYFLEFYGLFEKTTRQKHWLWLLNFSVVLTFFLSVLWVKPPFYIYLLAGMGAFLQAVIFVLLLFWLVPIWKDFASKLAPGVGAMLMWVGAILAIKIDMQLISAIPYMAMLAYQTLDFVIGYIHLVFLGVVTLALFAFLIQTRLLKFPKGLLRVYLIAFLVMEALLFYKGITLWLGGPLVSNYYLFLILTSILLTIAIGWLFVYSISKKSNYSKKAEY